MKVKGYAPTNFSELKEALSLLPENNLVFGGGTDLVIRMRERQLKPEAVLYLGDVKETQSIDLVGDELVIGSSVTMAQAQVDPLVNQHFCALVDGVMDIGSVQIRHRATLAGNVASASPAGDLLPILYMFQAVVETMGPSGEIQSIPIDQFVLGKGKTALKYNEVITAFRLPIPKGKRAYSAFYKLGSRMRVTISRIGISLLVWLDEEDRIEDCRIYLGATFPKPRRILSAEDIARGRPIDQSLTADIGKILFDIIYEVTPKGFERHDAKYYERYYRYYKPYSVLGVVEDVFERLLQAERC